MFKNKATKAWIKAAKANDVSALRLAHGLGNVDAATYGWKALRAAVMAGATDTTKYLIGVGYNLNRVDFWDQTLLCYAIQHGHPDIVKMLLDHGARPNQHKEHLSIAVQKGDHKSVQHLLDAGAYVNIKPSSGKTPLYVACAQNNIEIVDSLLKAGADTNVVYQYTTPLGIALYLKADEQIIKGLIVSGANMNIHENGRDFVKLVERHPVVTMDKIVSYKAETLIQENTLVEKKTVSKAGEMFEKLDDHQLLHTINSQSGLELTTIFNFQIGDILRVQVKDGIKISEDKTKFSELDDVNSLKPMFDKLVALGGNPKKLTPAKGRAAAPPKPQQ